jgi:uncharacterized protein YegL
MANNDCLETFCEKWLCLFLIDVSASMGLDSLNKLNKDLSDFHRLVSEDAISSAQFELCITTFGQEFQVLQEPSLVENFSMPTLGANNTDSVADTIKKAVEKLEARKCWYKSTGQIFYRPCLVLVTLEANDMLYYSNSFAQVRADVENRKYDFLNWGTNGTSVLAKGKNVSIRLKETRTLVQMMYFIHNYDTSLYDHLEDAPVYLEDDVLEGWVNFEI